jgi:hypothetical protein
MIWTAPANPSSPVWYVFAATWVPDSMLTVVQTPGLALEWPTNADGYHVQYATNLLSPVVWQRFSGNPSTNAGNFHQTIGPPTGSAACHVRPKAFYAACRVRRPVHRSLGEVGSLLRGIFPPLNRQSLRACFNHGWTRINTDLTAKDTKITKVGRGS